VANDIELWQAVQAGTSPRRCHHTVVARLADPSLERALARAQDRGRTPMLDRIDPLKDLELGPADMPQLLQELAIVSPMLADGTERHAVDELAALAARCRDDRSLVLAFIGD
jgi:hypothetical protein